MKVVILGCGRMGAMVASQFSASGHDVAIIDRDSANFRRLSPEYGGKKVVGNGTEQDTLRRAGIQGADVFVAITQGDNRNIMASQLARVVFDVPRVYTRIKDPLRAECFGRAGLNTFCTTILAASYLENAILGQSLLTEGQCALFPKPGSAAPAAVKTTG